MLKNKRTRIISGFPGVGKTDFFKKNPDTVLDLDSADYGWDEDDKGRPRNPEFPENYLKVIKENIGKYDYILVSTHEATRQALKDNCIFFYLLVPHAGGTGVKEEYMRRYKERGSPQSFIDLVSTNWTTWLRGCRMGKTGCQFISHSKSWFLSDMIKSIKDTEEAIEELNNG